MKISYSFASFKDLSNISNGERLLEILFSNGFVVDKAGDHEPIRKEFTPSNLPEMWKGKSCDFLFKGKKEINFSGMVIWNIDLHPNSKAFNGVHLWLNVPKNYSASKLVQLGDDIFSWSQAVYGYITGDDYTDPTYDPLKENIHDGIPGLMWANYFSPTYIMEQDFHVPNDHVSISHGIRIILSEKPNDERFHDSDFLQSIKDKIGSQWFQDQPRNYRKVPFFDKSAITKQA